MKMSNRAVARALGKDHHTIGRYLKEDWWPKDVHGLPSTEQDDLGEIKEAIAKHGGRNKVAVDCAWQLVATPGRERLYRSRVPGGWLLLRADRTSFYPDPEHAWLADSRQSLQVN